MALTEKDISEAAAKTSNWKSTGPDMIHNFWLKKLTSMQRRIANQFQEMIAKGKCPEWLPQGTTHLLKKSDAKASTDPSNYRPITCLNTTWKLLTSVLTKHITEHLKDHQLLSVEQKGYRKGSKGSKDHLLVDKAIMKDSMSRLTNLHMTWIDYKKAYDSVPHSWILESLKIHKVNTKIIKFITKSMKAWETSLTIAGKAITKVKICRGIFQGDAMSPLLFCIALNPLSTLLVDSNKGYSPKNSEKVSHLMYMDDIKLFAKSTREMESLVNITKIFSDDIRMTFGYDKCATVALKRGRLAEQTGINLEDNKIQELTDHPYKYLGVPEMENVKHELMKKKLEKEYRNR